MSFIKQISKAIKKPKRCHPHGRVAANFLLMFSFAVIGLSFLLYGTINGQLAKAQSGDWYNSDWRYRQKLTIEHTKVAGDLTDFPVLIQMTNVLNPLFTKAMSNGYDILFTSNDGTTQLNHEIEKYDNTTGELIAWVKCNLLAGTDAGIYMYYGNATASNQANPTGVWDANFKMVQHLSNAGGTATTTRDSTANGNHGTKIATDKPAETVGKIGMAQSFGGDGKIATPLNTAFGDFTVEVWFKDTLPVSQYERLLDKSYTAGFWLGRNYGVANSWGGGIKENSSDPEGDGGYGIFGTFTDGVWNHLVSVRSGATHLLYANGVLVKQNTVSGTPLDGTSVALGAWSDPTHAEQKLSGSLDEVRISDAVRNADWIKTAYNNENDPATFVSFGAEETPVMPITITITQPTEWQIGDTATIRWTIVPVGQTATFKIYYSDNNGADWITIDDNVIYQNQPIQTYDWPVPATINGPGESDFKIKIEAYDSLPVLVATAESDAFKIDYGPVYSWNFTASIEDGSNLYDLRDKLIVDTPFTLSATAKDQYGNLITNYDQRLDLQVFSTAGVTLTPNTLGEAGNTGNWDNGTVSFGGYILAGNIPETGTPITIEITNQPLTAVGRTVAIQLFKYGTLVFAPDGNSNWKVGTSHEIKYLAGGVPPCGTEGCVEKLAYSQDGGATFDFIKDGGNDIEHPFSPIFRTDAWSIVEGPEDWQIDPDHLDQKIFKVKAVIVDKGNNAIPDDDIELLSGNDITDAFIIGTSDALYGTYTSAKFNISNDAPTTDTMIKLTDFTVTIGGVQTDHSKIDFSLKFYDGSDNALFMDEDKFQTVDGWFTLEYLDADTLNVAGFDKDLQDFSDFSKVKTIQFKIYMETDNYQDNESNPFVQDIVLEYEIDTAAVVGTFNFDGGNTKSVARGSAVDFGVRIAIMSGYESQIGTIILRGEADDDTITIDPVTITGTGAANYTANVSFDTTNLAPLGDHNISISAEITGGSRMTLTPALLTGTLTITDATAQNFTLTWVGGADYNKTVQPGGIAPYNFIVTWDPSYSPDIILTTDITTVIGTSYIASVEYYDTDGVIVPGNTAVKPLVAPYTKTIELRVTTKTNGGEKSLTSFNITGTGNNIPKNISPAPSLTISNQPANLVTIVANAEVEGGTATSFAVPKFIIRLYKKGATSTYTEKTDVQAGSKDATTGKYVISASFDKATADANGKVVVGTTYIGYLRSTRHFWKKATTPTSGEITISASTNSYTLEFPKLLAGDIAPTAPDNQINSLDFQASLASFGQTLSNALNDFDNNGQINVLDIGFVLTNYFKSGDLLP